MTADREQQERWIADILRSYEIPKVKAEVIARALIEDGITTLGPAQEETA
jgi:hypothetical protein